MNGRFKKREIPWLGVVAFHKEIARRAEDSFFALPLGKTPSDRWSSITDLEPSDFAGNWRFSSDAIQSNSFRNLLHSGSLGNAFIGGPCWVRFIKKEDNRWRQEWCPFLYRSIRLDSQDDGQFRIVPEQGRWEVSPIVVAVLERKGFLPPKPFEDLIPEILEAASTNAQATNQPLTACLVEMLCGELPDFAELFAKNVNLADASHSPTRWVIFSPPPTGPLTQNLVRDYDRLLEIVKDATNNVGGLRLFEGFPDEEPTGRQEPTPIVPLNDSQRAAVRGILESKPITVISGPPGCGKSQVVLSLMLNAWQRGISVLFASNNNKAVDVVRDRLQRFESHFPIAIRAGSRKFSRLIQALADNLNFITSKKGRLSNAKENATAKRDDLLAKRNALRSFLDSKLPQRVDEAVRSALGAYATFRQIRAEMHSIKEELLREFHAFDVKSRPESFFQNMVTPLDGWLAKISEYQEILRQDDAKRKRLYAELNTACETRDRAAQRTGLNSSSITSWSWLVSGPGPELLRSWLDRFKELLAMPLDQRLTPYEWIADYEMWHGEEDAGNWAVSAKKLSSDIRYACGQLSPKLTHVETVKRRYDDQMSQVQQLAVPLEIAVNPAVLSDWSVAYALESSLPAARSDWFPWSQRRRAVQRMKKAEKTLRPFFPLTVWRGIGKLNSEGRDKLSKIVEETQAWLSVRSEWEATQPLRDEIEAVLGDLRGRCAELTAHESVPDVPDLGKWQEVARDLTDMALCADKAALAWRKRMFAEKAAADIRSVTTDFLAIASGVPIKEAWIQGPGHSFHEILMRLGSNPSPQSVVDGRTAIYTDALTVLIESWERGRDAENLSHQVQIDIAGIPTMQKRCDEWKAERPTNFTVKIDIPKDHLPEENDAVFDLLKKYRDWVSRWKQFNEQRQPELHKRSQEEYWWAVARTKEAIALLPEGNQKAATQKALHDILTSGTEDWPIAEIQSLFEAYSPDRIKARIEGLESQIEELSFDLAKQDWLQRMTADPDIQKALDGLHAHYCRNNERIEKSAFPLFRKALEAVPVWITVAQSPQSIPMLPDLFDILVIDEATQCTVTNILPLIYRAKRIVVIGDKEQLPAIPNISPAAESDLAAKLGIEEHLLDVIGHATLNLYDAAVRCLPVKTDVKALNEHYRSHPLIIGFSNSRIYKKTLTLRTAPAHVANLPFGSAVHGQHVSGHCERGRFNSSWRNPPEIEAVCDLVRRLRQLPEARSRSLGVVTPFRAQMEEITERLQRLQLSDGVTVGVVHTYQGDERDIMIFSPVLARGIGDGGSRFVEKPHNLINVAVTRARLALFVVADFDICRMQEGILGDLIKYVDTIEEIRRPKRHPNQHASEEELELFSWMVAQGWNPLVHHVERDIEIDFVLTHEGKRLAIEVDGDQHKNTTEDDKARDAFLRGRGYDDVLRISARAVRETPSPVIKQIGDITGLPVSV